MEVGTSDMVGPGVGIGLGMGVGHGVAVGGTELGAHVNLERWRMLGRLGGLVVSSSNHSSSIALIARKTTML